MADTVVELEGHRLRVRNLDKVLYPAVGFTKAEVIDYYVRVAPAMLPHVRGRGLTFKRYPDGVEADSFFEKRCPGHRPDFVGTVLGPGDRQGGIEYCCLDSVAALAWAANMAALEIHAPMATGDDIDAPRSCVFDLDPGAPADLTDCARVGLAIRDVLDGIGLECHAKTSGSKGMQLYVPLNTPHTHDHAGAFAHAVAQVLEKHRPDEVTSVMAKKQRPSKVFIDWSQNSRHKTTIAAYSLRARPEPTVSTPVSWDEVSDAAAGDVLSFTAPEVLDRVARLGDLFAPVAEVEQELPRVG
ncbi:MAG: non-homologous end-joining DNA ligase [Acidimicrobiales bacterium]|nr:non-homologous end-joining DNA ligase [Acidimicrobiales bacterium]